MANMSYCRFQNTLSDLRDCMYALDQLEEHPKENLSPEEYLAACALADKAEQFSQLWDEIIEQYKP